MKLQLSCHDLKMKTKCHHGKCFRRGVTCLNGWTKRSVCPQTPAAKHPHTTTVDPGVKNVWEVYTITMSQTIMQGVVTWYPVEKKNQKIEVVCINKTQRYSETKGVC